MMEKLGINARLFYCLGATLLAIGPNAASAQTAAVESLGVRPCSELIEANRSDETLYAAFGVWIGGYLTAANAYEADTFDLTPWQPIELATAQIAGACAQQQNATIAAATASYVNYLKTGRLQAQSELLQLRNGDTGIYLYKSVLADVRARLQAQGATITEPAGVYGQTFGEAVLSYQRENGLRQTGLPDTETLIHLYR